MKHLFIILWIRIPGCGYNPKLNGQNFQEREKVRISAYKRVFLGI